MATKGPLIVFGVMVSDAADGVGGWRCIQEQAETPRGQKIGKGRAIALVEDEDDAKLFAAAPELLAACEAFLRAPSVGSSGPASTTIVVQDFNLKAAREAVAKAKGQPFTMTLEEFQAADTAALRAAKGE